MLSSNDKCGGRPLLPYQLQHLPCFLDYAISIPCVQGQYSWKNSVINAPIYEHLDRAIAHRDSRRLPQ